MTTFKVTKEMTPTKIKNSIKINLLNEFEEYLTQKYGADATGMVRYGSTPKNELAFIVGTVDDEGFEYDIAVTINLTVKDWKEKKTKTRTTEAFDFEQYKSNYNDYLTDKAVKQVEKAEQKKSAKSAKQAEKEERKAEIEQAMQRANEKSKAKTAEQVTNAKEK